MRCQSAANRKIVLATNNNNFIPNYNPIISTKNINKDIISINNLNLQKNGKKYV